MSCLCVSLSGAGAVRAAAFQRILRVAACLAFCVGLLGAAVKYLDKQYEYLHLIMPDTMVYGTFTSVVGFLLVFRAGQSYVRFAEGASLMHVMQADFLDAATLLISLSRISSASQSALLDFRRVVVRLVSCLNMLCLSELGSVDLHDIGEIRSKCINLDGLDDTTLRIIEDTSECKAAVTCMLLHNVVSDATKTVLAGVPAPLLSRVYHELGNGMISFHEALKLRNVPFPFPLMVVTEILLLAHCIYTPFQMSTLAQGPVAAATFSGGFAFSVWTLYGLAAELDDPFGTDVNDLDLEHLQEHLNYRLLCLLVNSIAPPSYLVDEATDETQMLYNLGAKCVSFEAVKRDSIMVTVNQGANDPECHDEFPISPKKHEQYARSLTARVSKPIPMGHEPSMESSVWLSSRPSGKSDRGVGNYSRNSSGFDGIGQRTHSSGSHLTGKGPVHSNAALEAKPDIPDERRVLPQREHLSCDPDLRRGPPPDTFSRQFSAERAPWSALEPGSGEAAESRGSSKEPGSRQTSKERRIRSPREIARQEPDAVSLQACTPRGNDNVAIGHHQRKRFSNWKQRLRRLHFRRHAGQHSR